MNGDMEKVLPGLAGFNRYFENDLSPLLLDLEAERPALMQNFYVYVAGAVLLFCLGAYFILIRHVAQTDVMVLVGMGCAGIIYWGYRPLGALKNKAKITVMDHLCSYLGLDYQETPYAVSLGTHRSLFLIPSYDESKVEDQVMGKVDEVDFNLFEAKLVTVSRDSKGRKTKSTVFRGLLAEFDFHKNFHGTTLITKDHTMFGNFFGKWGKGGDRVKLEDPIFEKEFEVYATDQVEARYLLTPTFMERICTLSGHVGSGNLQLAFDKGNLYLSIRKKKNSFEGGSAFSNLADPKHVHQTIQELVLIYDIVQKLKLDMDTRV